MEWQSPRWAFDALDQNRRPSRASVLEPAIGPHNPHVPGVESGVDWSFRRDKGGKFTSGGGGGKSSESAPAEKPLSVEQRQVLWRHGGKANLPKNVRDSDHAEDWANEWRPPGWDDKAQDAWDSPSWQEHRVNRDQGKFAAQRQLPRARDHGFQRRQRTMDAFDQLRERAMNQAARIAAATADQAILAPSGGPPAHLRRRAMDMALRIVATDSRPRLAFDHALVRGALKSQVMRIALDATTVRTFSPDGHMHVALSNISRAAVNPYWGKEIPGAEDLGLDPEKKYWLLRHPDELMKSASSFNGIPILIDHKPIAADDHPSDLVIGSTGTDAHWAPPFLQNSLHFWDGAAIDAIRSNERRELSCAYHYTPDMTPGVYEGKRYDGIMRDIHGNHVALVPDGRVGPAAVVADSLSFDQQVDMWFR